MTDTLAERIEAASGPSDDTVWRAYEAMRDEGKRWRVIDFNGRAATAVRDIRPASDYPVPPNYQETFERQDFSTAKLAADYIDWRTVKAGLQAIRAHGGEG